MSTPRVRIRLFGGLEVTVGDGPPLEVGPMRCQAVLATLALTPCETVTVSRLIDAVWGEDDPPRTVDKTLQSYVSVLRRALESHGVEIDRVGAAYVLKVDRAAVDVWRFEQHLARDDTAAALAEWRGEPLAGLDVPGLAAVIAGLVARWQGASEAYLRRLIDSGRASEAISTLAELTASHPYRENLWALLMTALYLVGRQADALQAYAEARSRLVEGLGVEPGVALKELEAAILRQDPELVTPGASQERQAGVSPSAGERRTMAFLFTDIEGSTQRWERYPDAMMDAVATHDACIEAAVISCGGSVFHRSGDGMIASFPHASAAVEAAALVHQRLASLDLGNVGGLKVRESVHVGHVVVRDGEPFGWALNFGSRLMSTGHGGQILLSEATVDTLGGDVGSDFGFVSLGLARLRDIAHPAHVFQLIGAGLDRGFPPLRTRSVLRRLPAPATTTIGRDGELAALGRDIAAHRLVTVVGARGVGASRLSLAAARDCAEGFTDGVVHSDFAGVDPERAIDAIATSLQVGTRPGHSIAQSILEWLAAQELLLVWDHCDAAAETVRPLIMSVLDQAPGVTVLCTANRSLGIDGERVHRLGPLGIDAAATLFQDRASAAGANVVDNDALRALCERLDRMPLSIELAAANATIYSISELNTLFDRHVDRDRAESALMLGSMHDAIAVTLESVSPELRAMLGAATVFAGPFTRSAFADVCAPAITPIHAGAALRELVDRSLVQVNDDGGERCFRVLETVADVARRDLSDRDRTEANKRFVSWVVSFAEAAANGLRGPEEAAWNRRIGEQFPNTRAGFERAAAAGDLARAASICTVLWDYGFMRLNDEYFEWSARLLDAFPAGDPALLAPVYGAAAFGAWLRDELDLVVRFADRAISLEREFGLDFDLTARLALISATTYSNLRRVSPELLAELGAHQRSRPELYFHVNVEVQQSIMATWVGRPDSAIRHGVRAVQLARESKNPSSEAFALWALGSALQHEDPEQGETLLASALQAGREVGNVWTTALVQMGLASLRQRTGTAIDAVPLLVDLLGLLQRAGHRSHLWATLRLCALVLGDLGHDRLAVQLHAWVREARLAMPALPVDAAAAEVQLASIVSTHGEDWVQRSALLTTSWTLDSAVALVRAELVGCLSGEPL